MPRKVEISVDKLPNETIKQIFQYTSAKDIRHVHINLSEGYCHGGINHNTFGRKYMILSRALAALPNLEEISFSAKNITYEHCNHIAAILEQCYNTITTIRFGKIVAFQSIELLKKILNKHFFPRLKELDFSENEHENFNSINDFIEFINTAVKDGLELSLTMLNFGCNSGDIRHIDDKAAANIKLFLQSHPQLQVIFPIEIIKKFETLAPEDYREIAAMLAERAATLEMAKQLVNLNDLLAKITKARKTISDLEDAIQRIPTESLKELHEQHLVILKGHMHTLNHPTAVLEFLSAEAKYNCAKVLISEEYLYITGAIPCFINLITTESIYWQELAIFELIRLAADRKIKHSQSRTDNSYNLSTLILVEVKDRESVTDAEQALLSVDLALMITGVTDKGKEAHELASTILRRYVCVDGIPTADRQFPPQIFAKPAELIKLLAGTLRSERAVNPTRNMTNQNAQPPLLFLANTSDGTNLTDQQIGNLPATDTLVFNGTNQKPAF